MEHKQTHPDLKHSDLYQFKRNVSKCWIKKNESKTYRRLRKGPGRWASQVPRSLRFDGEDHWPYSFSGYTGRHRCSLCNKFTNMYCLKCRVNLCCHSARNCFTTFHTEEKGKVVHLPAFLMLHSYSDQECDVDNPDKEPHDTESVPSDLESDPEYIQEN